MAKDLSRCWLRIKSLFRIIRRFIFDLQKLAALVTVLTLPLIFYQILQTNRSLELATEPILSVKAELDENGIKTIIQNQSLSNLENVDVWVDVLVFPKKVNKKTVICDFLDLGRKNSKLSANNNLVNIFSGKNIFLQISKIQSEAYKAPINGVVRVRISAERQIDHRIFNNAKNFFIFNENSLIPLTDLAGIIIETDDDGESPTLNATPIGETINEAILKYNERMYPFDDEIFQCPFYSPQTDTYHMVPPK